MSAVDRPIAGFAESFISPTEFSLLSEDEILDRFIQPMLRAARRNTKTWDAVKVLLRLSILPQQQWQMDSLMRGDDE